MRLIRMYLSDLKELLEAKEFHSVRSALRMISPVDLADGWEHFGLEERKVLFKLSSRQRALQLFEELDMPHQEELLSALRQEEVQELVEELDPSETGRLLRSLPKPLVRQLGSILKRGKHNEKVESFLQFKEKSVGGLMRANYVTVDPRWTCRQALDRISMSTRLRHIERTHLDTLYVVDAGNRLYGTVALKELVVAPANMLVKDLTNLTPETLTPEMDQEEAAKIFSRYKMRSAPVVDGERRLLGVMLYRDIVDVVQEETEEDFAKMVGVKAGLLSHSVFSITKIRLPWLIATCLGELGVSWIVKQYEPTLAQVIALATFMPLIAAMGGNVGAQTATVVVRGLATGEIPQGKGRHAIVKEILVGVLLGLFYGLVIGLAAHLFYGERYGWWFSAVVGAGMLVSMVTAATMGSVEPFIFRMAGIDPATATGPLITTFTDILSTTVYLTFATYFLLK